jgi:AcrR family transcriptional regulator
VTASRGRLSHRERKKRQTRQKIVAVAVRLFAENGYVRTTLAEIAEGAEISPSTFFLYFPSKADVVFAAVDGMLEDLSARIVNRPPGDPVSAVLLAWVEEDLPEVELPAKEVLAPLPEIIAAVAELRSAERLRLATLEDTLATAFAGDLGEPADGLRARLMAVIALRGILGVWETWYQHRASETHVGRSDSIAPISRKLEQALSSGMTAIESLPRVA